MKNKTALTSGVALNRALFLLSLLGIAIAVYVLEGWLRKSSLICLTGGGCALVQKSPYSYPFGIPVPAIGLLGYSILAVLSLLHTLGTKRWILSGLLGMAGFGVVFVSWFTFMEVFYIRGLCTWCILSALNMIIIFMIVLRLYRLDKGIQ
ncbi:vitamin K epoxide reductase family protein [Patescibacteria group bacterium]|nr:vitamin K epoxide reductase family protein [Patescibacteria group bacterium]